MPDSFLASSPVGRDLLAVDWSSTAVGPPESWPPFLRTTVRTILGSRFPMWMAWGPSLTFFCNDAYRRDTLGDKYPWALGRPASEVWSEIWDDIGPRIGLVIDGGESTWDERLLLMLERSGFTEETFHTFSYSPLVDDDDQVAGMLCVVSEDTHEVIANRRIAALRDLSGRLTAQLSEDGTVKAAAAALEPYGADLPFHLVYLHDGDGAARLAWSGDIAPGHPAAPERQLPGCPDTVWWPTATAGPTLVELAPDRFPGLPGGPWDVAPTLAAVVPVQGAQGASYGFLVVGLNPFRPFDDDYRDFLELLAGRLGAAITDARAYDAERRRAESLAALDRAKTDFFTNVSHEFRTPLTLLLGPTEDALADTGEPLGPHQRERMEVVHRNGLRLLKLVNSLLDFSRLEGGRMVGRFEPVDLGASTRQLASMFEGAAERLGLTLDIACDTLPEPVHVDPDLWGKVVLNLLSNALKFTLEGGIDVRLHAEPGHAVLVVRDTGVGIPEDEQGNLFERFHRVHGTAGRSHEGSGIGLALVAEIVALHGGHVIAQSAPGDGTTFTVRLPVGTGHLPAGQLVDESGSGVADQVVEGFLAEASQLLASGRGTVSVTPAGNAAPGPEGRPRVLVVDDNADIRTYVTEVLAPHYEVVTAVDGHTALATAREEVPDLVLSDVMMPGLDGFELLAELRRDPATLAIPVVLVSARGDEQSAAEGLEAGADDYLAKPFGARELLARVGANLELDRTRRTRLELERSRELLDEAERLARMGSWAVRLETGRIDVSHELLRLTGRTREEIDAAGHPGFVADLVAVADRPFVRAVLGEARLGDQIAFELPMSRADGSPFHAGVRGEVVAHPDHGPVLRCSLQDVTERHRAAIAAQTAGAAAEAAAREHAIADELQASLLPERSFDLDQLGVATYYRAGSEGTKVGGDWYDVIELEHGCTGLVLGDVMGHGVRAAAVMGQIRTALRAYARLGMPPRVVMESLDALIRDLFPDEIATCVYAVFDPDGRTLDVVSAGHLPPLVIGADGRARRVNIEPHPPLGLGRPFAAEHRIVLEPGAGLLLYTDGLVERRGSDLDTGIASLERFASALTVPLPDVPTTLVRAMGAQAAEDDVAVLVARTSHDPAREPGQA